MNKYTVEQVEVVAGIHEDVRFADEKNRDKLADKTAGMLRDYAALPRERESAKAPMLTKPVELPIDHPSTKIGAWLSAALDDPGVCAEMKADITAWFNAGKPMPANEETLRFFAGGPQGYFYCDRAQDAEELIIRAHFDREDWTITDLYKSRERE